MKKLFTILAMCFGVFALNAQNATIVLTAGDVWGDGTGYQMLISSTPVNFSDTSIWWPTCGADYNSTWDYRIPSNASGLDGSSIIINSTGSVSVPAGSYSFVILNPTCKSEQEIDSMAQADWSVNQAQYEAYGYTYDEIYDFYYANNTKVWPASLSCDASRGDMTFEANKTYTFTLSLAQKSGDCTTLTVTGGDDPTPGPGDGISETDAQAFGLYPNPATEVLNVKANDVKEIEIVNLLGQTVITTNVQTINVASLTNGVYFVRVNYNNGTVSTQKFVKE